MSYSNLEVSSASFNDMLKRFGVVTVMNADIYEFNPEANDKALPAILDLYQGEPLVHLDTLKVANVTIEGPDKTVTGGQFANPLIKFGKSARLEMQDALGNADAIERLCGGLVEHFNNNNVLHMTELFAGPLTIIGDTFFIDQKTGMPVKTKIIFYQMLPDSIFNLSQDAEGDATVFDMNGDLLTTIVKVGDKDTNKRSIGLFYSVFSGDANPTDGEAAARVDFNQEAAQVTINVATAEHINVSVNEGPWALADGTSTTATVAKAGDIVDVIAYKADKEIARSRYIAGPVA